MMLRHHVTCVVQTMRETHTQRAEMFTGCGSWCQTWLNTSWWSLNSSAWVDQTSTQEVYYCLCLDGRLVQHNTCHTDASSRKIQQGAMRKPGAVGCGILLWPAWSNSDGFKFNTMPSESSKDVWAYIHTSLHLIILNRLFIVSGWVSYHSWEDADSDSLPWALSVDLMTWTVEISLLPIYNTPYTQSSVQIKGYCL